MTPDWRKAARRARSKMDPTRNAGEGAVAGLGVAVAIGAMEWLSLASHYPLAIIPFATSIALVIGSPDAEQAQPRALLGGHVVATLVGLAMVTLTGPSAWAAAMAVGLAILAMYLTDTFHPPPESTRCWWSPTICRGHFCLRRCLSARCFLPHLLTFGTDGSGASRGRSAGCKPAA